MIAPTELRPPSNWQDFETLCKKLWGEIWKCPEIKKNGRNGQNQHGVDVYGEPFDKAGYYAIQCKGKNNYTHKQFTEEEITEEIEKAKLFEPPLIKLYFATTAVKNAKIEAFVRKKNVENKAKRLFGVDIFSWEDIVELIDENKQTHDWYLKHQNFKTSRSVAVTFQNGIEELTIEPQFKKRRTHYRAEESSGLLSMKNRSKLQTIYMAASMHISETTVNLSYCGFNFQIYNTGDEPMEEYKLLFDFNKEIKYISKTNIKSNNLLSEIMPIRYVPDVYLDENTLAGEVIPQKKILVSEDAFTSEEFFIKPFPKDYEIKVKWKLISKNFKDKGQLKIIVKPQIIDIPCNVFVDDMPNVAIKEGNIEDMVVNKKD